MLHHTDYFNTRLLAFYPGMVRKPHGLEYILILIHYVNQDIHVFRLKVMVDPPLWKTTEEDYRQYLVENYMSIVMGSPDTPIEKKDYQTIMDVNRRIARLRELEQIKASYHDYGALKDIRTEIDKLNFYLENDYGIRDDNDKLKKLILTAYHSVDMDVRRFLQHVMKQDEQFYWQIKAHLRIGMVCTCIDDAPDSIHYLDNLSNNYHPYHSDDDDEVENG